MIDILLDNKLKRTEEEKKKNASITKDYMITFI